MFGKVQGVFFRASAREEAVALGLTGYVENEGDGSVSMLAAGEKEDLDKLVSWCHKGPPRAKVEKVVVAESTHEALTGFVIKR